MRLAKAIKDVRLMRGMRQEDVARASGMKQATISRLESGQQANPPTLQTLARLAEAMGVELIVKFKVKTNGNTIQAKM